MLAVWGLALVLALPGLARLKLRTDGRSLVPPRAPAVLVDRQVRQTFGLRDPLLVLVESADPRLLGWHLFEQVERESFHRGLCRRVAVRQAPCRRPTRNRRAVGGMG